MADMYRCGPDTGRFRAHHRLCYHGLLFIALCMALAGCEAAPWSHAPVATGTPDGKVPVSQTLVPTPTARDAAFPTPSTWAVPLVEIGVLQDATRRTGAGQPLRGYGAIWLVYSPPGSDPCIEATAASQLTEGVPGYSLRAGGQSSDRYRYYSSLQGDITLCSEVTPPDGSVPGTEVPIREAVEPMPTPGLDAIPTPVTLKIPSLEDRARADAAHRAGIAPGNVRLVDFGFARWSSGAQGCPEPGKPYTAAMTWGYTLEAGGRRYQYHAPMGLGVFYCARP